MKRPSFVLIMTDSQGANDIGCYGRHELSTPRIDGLAARGIRFTHAYDSTPICTPARAALFTGLNPHSAGAWANEMALQANALTIGQRFRDAGYDTAYIGKWHLDGIDYFDRGRAPDGWDDRWWFDGRRYLDELGPERARLWRGLDSTEKLLAADIEPGFTWAHRIGERALRFLAEPRERPFLLVLSYDEPHGPCAAPKAYVERFRDHVWDPGPNRDDDLRGKPAIHRVLRDRARGGFLPDGRLHYPPYFACNSFVDHEIGRVLDGVDALAPPDTFLLFTSDHGQYKGAHGLSGKGIAMYEEATRVPLIIRQPGDRGAGKVEATLASHVDVAPTLLDLAGLPVPPVLEGASLRPVLDGAAQPGKAVFIEWNRADLDAHGVGGFFPVRCVREGSLKLVINLQDSDELYDLSSDPHELDNRIGDPACAAVRDRLHEVVLDWMDATRDPFRGPQWYDRPWHASARRRDFHGGSKARPADDHMPPVLDYWTGQPRADAQAWPPADAPIGDPKR